MAKLFGGQKKFDPKGKKDMGEFDVIPDGWYNAQITESDYVQNSKKNGHFAKLKFQIIDGKYKGRLLFVNLNLDNPSDEAVDAAESELATICRAIGAGAIEDTKELHGKPMKIKIAKKPASGGYPEGNKINGYKKLDGLATPSVSSDSDDEEDNEEKPKPKSKKPNLSFDDDD